METCRRDGTDDWTVTPRNGRERLHCARGAWKVPASARGAKVACVVYGRYTEYLGSRTEPSRAVRVKG